MHTLTTTAAVASPAATFAALAVTLLITHHVCDHWVQTTHQAGHKHLPGWPGRLACASHVGTYTLGTSATTALVWLALDLPISLLGWFAGQLISAVTHYWADRRTTLRGLAETVDQAGFYALGTPRTLRVAVVDDTGTPVLDTDGRVVTAPIDVPTLGTGAYQLDQSWHWAWLGVAALVTTVL